MKGKKENERTEKVRKEIQKEKKINRVKIKKC